MKAIFAYVPKVKKLDYEKDQFITKWHVSGIYKTLSK